MMTKHGEFIEYCELLERLESTRSYNHLLLGNGFNMALNIPTGYKDIYKTMTKLYDDYKKLESLFTAKEYDVEKVIKHLRCQIHLNIENKEEKKFLKSYIENQIRLDFMKALYEIVEPHASEIYFRKKDVIWNFLEKFRTYSTLNFDPFLYMLLLQYKPDKRKAAKSQQNKEAEVLFSTVETRREYLLSLVEAAYDENGQLILEMIDTENFVISELDNEDIKPIFLKHCINKFQKITGASKQEIENAVTEFFNKIHKTSKPKGLDISPEHTKTVEDDSDLFLEFKDGFVRSQGQLIFNESNMNQNINFLHGCLHITKNSLGQHIKVYRDRDNKESFISKIESAIHSQNQKIICVLSGDSNSKINKIKDSIYLDRCYANLKSLKGVAVVLGCSFDINDKHIFKILDSDKIQKVYISTSKYELPKFKNQVEKIIDNSNNKVTYFNYKKLPFSEKVSDDFDQDLF